MDNLNEPQRRRSVFVIGSGLVGHASHIAETFAQHEMKVVFIENDEEASFLRMPPPRAMPLIELPNFDIKQKIKPSPTEIRLVKMNAKIGCREYGFNEDGSKCTDGKPFFVCRANTEVQANKKFKNYKRNRQ